MARRFDRKQSGPQGGDRPSADEPDAEQDLSTEELELHQAEALPDRAALSTLNTDVGIPVDPALAADVLSGVGTDGSEETEAESPDESDVDRG